MVLRHVDIDSDGDIDPADAAAPGGRQFALQDANFNVTAVVTRSSAGDWGVAERYVYDPYGTKTVLNGAAGFDADVTGVTLEWSADANNVSDRGFVHGHQGGRAMWAETELDFRNRFLLTNLGRWGQVDPLGYVDGGSYYLAYEARPIGSLDPQGLTVLIKGGTKPVRDEKGEIVDVAEDDESKQKLTGVLARMKRCKEFKQLYDYLEAHDRVVTIIAVPSGGGLDSPLGETGPTGDDPVGDRHNGQGVDVTVRIDIDFTSLNMGDWEVTLETIIAHELAHAKDYADGALDRDKDKAEGPAIAAENQYRACVGLKPRPARGPGHHERK
ncbi:MAG TPA: M91 family zinc metallopeptidase [Tepidisphaeraceae bacterium]|nr:M91 family zinc metallopeptidase [Tepidisphaeraceae bacterium]